MEFQDIQKQPPSEGRSQSQSEEFGDGSQMSVKLRARLDKLAEWRIDHSNIEFTDDEKSRKKGGYATVHRATLVFDPSSLTKSNKGAEASEKKGVWRKDIAVKKMKIKDAKDRCRILGLALREAEFLIDLAAEDVNDLKIVELEGFVEDLSNDQIWLLFQWADNGNLKDFVASVGWELPERLMLIKDVASGVRFLHSQNPPICHGDLKSINILVTANHRAVIADFGAARRLGPNGTVRKPKSDRLEKLKRDDIVLEASFQSTTNTITLSSSQFTLRWAAPELLKEEECGLEVDIWALGCVLWEIITGNIPFEDVKNATVTFRVLKGDMPALTGESRVSVMRLTSLMQLCWRSDKEARPKAKDICESLERLSTSLRDPEKTVDPGAPRANRFIQVGTKHLKSDQYSSASEAFNRALTIFTDDNDVEGTVEVLKRLALVHQSLGEYSQAISNLLEVNQLYIETGKDNLRVPTLFRLARAHEHLQRYTTAIALYHEAIILCDKVGLKGAKSFALTELAYVEILQKKHSEATGSAGI